MCTIDVPATGKRIRQLRIESGMTIADLQKACGVTAAAVCKWQRGETMPSIDNLVILAALLDVTLDDIVVVGKSAVRKCG